MWLKERHTHHTPCVLSIAGYDIASQLQGIQGFNRWSEIVSNRHKIMMSWPSIVDQFVWHFGPEYLCVHRCLICRWTPQSYPKSCFSYGWENRACSRATVWIWGLGGVGWGNNVHVTCNLKWCYTRATSWLGVWALGGAGWGGVGWGNAVHFTCNNVHYANTPMMKTPEETSKFMIWEASSWERAACSCHWCFEMCAHDARMVAKASWWQTVPHVTLNLPVKIIWAMKRNHSKGIFCIKKKKAWGTVLCTPVVSMECGKFPKVQCQVLGANAKMEL